MSVREPLTIDHFNLIIGSDRLRFAKTDPPDAEGPPLLVFNGIGEGEVFVEPLMRRLPRLRTIAFDLPGVGVSQPSTVPHRLAGYANVMREVLDALRVDRAHVFGLDWGGALAQEFVRLFPERVLRLVLAATTTGRMTIPRRAAAWLHALSPLRSVADGYFRRSAGELYGGDFRRDAAQRAATAPSLVSPSLVSPSLVSPPLAGWINQLYALAGWTSRPWLRTIRRPTLVMAGSDDPIAPIDEARALASGIPNATLEEFDCGHLFILTRPDRVVASLERFLLQSTV